MSWRALVGRIERLAGRMAAESRRAIAAEIELEKLANECRALIPGQEQTR